MLIKEIGSIYPAIWIDYFFYTLLAHTHFKTDTGEDEAADRSKRSIM